MSVLAFLQSTAPAIIVGVFMFYLQRHTTGNADWRQKVDDKLQGIETRLAVHDASISFQDKTFHEMKEDIRQLRKLMERLVTLAGQEEHLLRKILKGDTDDS